MILPLAEGQRARGALSWGGSSTGPERFALRHLVQEVSRVKWLQTSILLMVTHDEDVAHRMQRMVRMRDERVVPRDIGTSSMRSSVPTDRCSCPKS